jgi:plastocyanin
MSAPRLVVWALIAVAIWPARDAPAVSRREACRLACGPAIEQCVAEGGRPRRCKRLALRDCRRGGVDACAVATTTSTTGAEPTTSVPGAPTTSGASTTFGPTTTGAGTTTTAAGSTTSTPAPTTRSTTFREVHGCTLDVAVDRSAPGDDRTVTFAPYQYTPKCIRIAAGETVTFSGAFAEHPLVGGEIMGFDAVPDPSSPITPTSSGSTKDVLFESGGTYPFYCDFHGVTQGMVGAVLVNP